MKMSLLEVLHAQHKALSIVQESIEDTIALIVTPKPAAKHTNGNGAVKTAKVKDWRQSKAFREKCSRAQRERWARVRAHTPVVVGGGTTAEEN